MSPWDANAFAIWVVLYAGMNFGKGNGRFDCAGAGAKADLIAVALGCTMQGECVAVFDKMRVSPVSSVIGSLPPQRQFQQAAAFGFSGPEIVPEPSRSPGFIAQPELEA